MSFPSTSLQKPLFTKSQYFTQSKDSNEWYCNICTPYNSGHIDYMSTQAAQHHERHSIEHAQNITESEMWWNPPAPDATAWIGPRIEDPPLSTEEMKIREEQIHVDNVQDMVPFWIRGVEAAEKGEVLRLEQFLETLQAASDAWSSRDTWNHGNLDNEWGYNEWGVTSQRDNDNDGNGWSQGNGAEGWGVESKTTWSARGSTVDVVGRPETVRRGQNREQQQTQSIGLTGNKKRKAMHRNAYDFVEEVARQEAVDEERKRRMHRFFDMPTHEKLNKIDEVIRHLRAVKG